ncbi:hypothetical protein PR202_gb25898 [Eleusine coracana subsp. coracana]|uniref:AB hydrolase-1 domain-containing protein n=1 Tax=Eleusine coracana subsp. coracana TaxID=191504 RepID=A0AAV5FMK0_ELECO|nr:hypothetical protein PR202_gb25898 [Eleusine coracana subsp. coracana]
MGIVEEAHNLRVVGEGKRGVIVLAHGFGTDQSVWKHLVPHLVADYRVVLFDTMGAGPTNPDYFDLTRYATLEGYALDLLAILQELGVESCIYVGHSVSAVIGVLASISRPDLFSKLVLLSASPRLGFPSSLSLFLSLSPTRRRRRRPPPPLAGAPPSSSSSCGTATAAAAGLPRAWAAVATAPPAASTDPAAGGPDLANGAPDPAAAACAGPAAAAPGPAAAEGTPATAAAPGPAAAERTTATAAAPDLAAVARAAPVLDIPAAAAGPPPADLAAAVPAASLAHVGPAAGAGGTAMGQATAGAPRCLTAAAKGKQVDSGPDFVAAGGMSPDPYTGLCMPPSILLVGASSPTAAAASTDPGLAA